MYFLVEVCSDTLLPVFRVVNYIINALMIGIPIILIILGMIDLGKAVIASKEDEVKKATKAFGKRFLYAVAVFLVSWLVTVVFDVVANLTSGTNADDGVNATTNETWQACWKKIRAS